MKNRFGPSIALTMLLALSLHVLVDLPEEVSAYTPHGPIVIDGNGDFTAANGVVSGNGTWDDPFIIEGWEIDDPDNRSIYINSTSAHLIIRNVYVHSGISNSKGGIRISNSSNITVSSSLITDSYHSLTIAGGKNNTVVDNNISFNIHGFAIVFTEDLLVANNTFWDNGMFLYDHRQETLESLRIASDNMVNGKPVLYLVNQSSLHLENTSIGQLFLVNVTDSTIEDLSISHTWVAIWAIRARNLTFLNLNLSDNRNGLMVRGCNDGQYCNENITIKSCLFANNIHAGLSVVDTQGGNLRFNTAWHNGVGIDMVIVKNISTYGNDVSKNYRGFYLIVSLRNLRIERNNISLNHYGIYVSVGTGTGCDDSLVFHNVIEGNSYQAWEPTPLWTPKCIQWDNGYPSGGNYWSDYSGVDFYRGPRQNIRGSDGIGDTPYLIDNDSIDRYPLISPGTVYPSPPENVDAVLSGRDFENVTIKWDPSDDETTGLVDRYDIYRSENYDVGGNLYEHIGSVPNGTHELVDMFAGEGNPDTYFYMICAVNMTNTSTCADNQAGKFTRPLAPGPNLVSIPLVQSNESIETVLQTVEYGKAWLYDSSAQEWKWYMEFKGYRKGLWTVNHTMGIWVDVTDDSNLTVAGVVPTQTTKQLFEGWNLVSFPSFNASYAVSDLKAETGTTKVEGYNPTPPYYLRILTDAEALQAGYGYWVRVDLDTVWNIEVT